MLRSVWSKAQRVNSYAINHPQMSRINRINLRRLSSTDSATYQASSLLKSAAAIFISGAGLLAYFRYEKTKAELTRKTTSKAQGVGAPLVGGPFTLTDVDGVERTEKDYLGKYTLVYFGYTFCPDVCPEELEKMAESCDMLEKEGLTNIVPLFVSVDPKRDSLAIIKEYLLEFSPKFVGLTGTNDQIKKIAKAYRIYFSAPPKSLNTEEADYLVDHSIYFFLMGPDGNYLCHFAKIDTARGVAEKVKSFMKPISNTAI